MTRKGMLIKSTSFVAVVELVCLQPVLEHRQRRGRHNITWQVIPFHTNGGGISSRCPWGDDNLCWLLWYSEPLLTLLICGCLSQYTALAVPVACWAVFWFHRKWIQNWTGCETDALLFIHTCISDPILYAHWTMACGRLLLTMYWCHMQSSSLDIYHVSCRDFLCRSVTV